VTAFDADAYRAAREPFRLVAGGRIYAARPVSAELVIATRPALASETRASRLAALRRLLRAAFPWRWSMLWRGDPVRVFLRLDAATQQEALRRFFRYLGAGSTHRAPATTGMS
jgi:hypothetical protein